MDWNFGIGLLVIASNQTLSFRGLEARGLFGPVGTVARFVRQSFGARLLFRDSIRVREAALPLQDALVNIRALRRSASCLVDPGCNHGPQNVSLLATFTYNTTRLPELAVLPGAILMSDLSTDIPADSTLASQNILYGGYETVISNSWYVAEHIVDPSCTASGRPGDDCVEELLRQLRGAGAPPPVAAVAPVQTSSDGSTDTAAIVGGVVGGTLGLALLGAAAAALLYRRKLRAAAERRAADKGGPADLELGKAVKGEKPNGSHIAASGNGTSGDSGAPGVRPQTPEVQAQVPTAQQPYTDLSARLPDGTPLGSVAQVVAGMAEAVEAAERAASQIQHSPEAPDGAPAGGVGPKPPSAQSGETAAAPPAPAEELGQLCSSMRARVRDVVIRLECVIGAGSFGTVYKGTWQGLPVAVKTLVFSANAENRQRALQEAALCESISHPNIIATYTSELQPLAELNSSVSPPVAEEGTESSSLPLGPSVKDTESQPLLDWRLYIVQDFADGGPLKRLYGKKSVWPGPNLPYLPGIVGLALGIARALDHLHSKRIIHGDLNPNNVLLKRDPEEPSGYVVKVADLGLSMLLPEDHTHLSNRRCGTMFYIAPEVVLGAQLGTAADVFSLGVILWELAAGRGAGVSTPAGPRYHASFPSFGPTCPAPYTTLALACLQRQPQNRPSAAFVREALESLMDALQPA